MFKSTKNILGLFLAITSAFMLYAAHTASGAAIVWDGAVNNDWDTATANWTGSTYTDGDDVTFSNTAGGVINLTANRAPGSTVVSAASGTYTFSGSAITSGTLTKSGGGTLVLNSPYTSSGIITNGDSVGKIQWGASDLIADNVRLIGFSGGVANWDMANFNETIRGINRRVNITNMGDLTIATGDDTWAGGTSISGNGKLTFASTHGFTTWGPKATHTGGTFIQGGKVELYVSTTNAFPVTGEVTVDAGARWSLNFHESFANASSEESVGKIWLGEGAEVVIEGCFVGFLGAETVRFSGDQF